MPPRTPPVAVPAVTGSVPVTRSAPPRRWQAWPWLGVGLLVFWGGQRWLRDSPIGAEHRVIDAAFAMLLGLGALGIWAARNQAGEKPATPQEAESSHPHHGVFGTLVGLAAVLILVSALAATDTQTAAGLRLGALLLFFLAGWSWPRKWAWPGRDGAARSWGIGLGLTGATLVVRLLFVAPLVPDWGMQTLSPTVLGDLYQVLGSQRAVLVPFALACLWPVGVWWICRRLAREPWALSAGILAMLSPFQIWQSLPASPWGLAPFVLLCVVGAGVQVTSAPRPGGWFWLGLGLGILWVEASLWRPLLLITMLLLSLPLFFRLVSGPHRPGWMQGLYAGLGLAAGLLLYRQAALGDLSGFPQEPGAWGEILYPPQILAYWFQPGMLELPYKVTYFLFLDGLLSLGGLVLVLVRIRYRPLPALGGIAWAGGLVYASQDASLFLSLSHLTAVVPWLLVTVALSELMPPLRQIAATVLDWEITERGLVAGVACLFLWQLPGGILGFNPLVELRAQMTGQATTALPEPVPDRVEPVTVGDFVGETAPLWPATLVWRTAGTCLEGTPVMTQPRGVAIDLGSRHVYVVGGEPGMMATLDLDQDGQVRARWTEGLRDPVEVAVLTDGTLRILDAGINGIWTMDPGNNALSMLTGGRDIYRPRGFQVLRDGQMLVAATGSNRIVRYGADGAWIEDFASWPGSINLEQPTDVLAIGSRLWVIAPQQSWLREMYSGLQLEVTAPSHTLAGPHMAALADGTFLLTDSEAGRILHMQADGRLQGIVDVGPALRRPVDIDLAENTEGIWMAVTDAGFCRVSLWQLDPAPAVLPANE